jgi:hypothetical protein
MKGGILLENSSSVIATKEYLPLSKVRLIMETRFGWSMHEINLAGLVL